MTADPSDPDTGSPRRHPALAPQLRDRIAAEGPITFADFMDSALYDPVDGFYAQPPVGAGGHFVTSPHVSVAFGALVARQVRQFWDLLDRPSPFTVVEAGAGDGTLARQILASLDDPAMVGAIRYVAVERSTGSLDVLAGSGIEAVDDLDRLEGGFDGCLIANELLDNLPFHLVEGTNAGPAELFVDSEGAAFALVQGAPSVPHLAQLSGRVPPGERRVVPLEALRFIERAASLFQRGYLWLADYGAAQGPAGASRAAAGPAVHGYRGHRFLEDILDDPGSRDITAGVDFDLLARHAAGLGLHVWGPASQREVLLGLGFDDWNARARAAQAGALDAGLGLEAARTYAERTRAAMLIDPQGLGGFLVLCLGVGTDRPPPSLHPAA